MRTPGYPKAQEKPTEGEVVAMGPGKTHPETGIPIPLPCEIGDKVRAAHRQPGLVPVFFVSSHPWSIYCRVLWPTFSGVSSVLEVAVLKVKSRSTKLGNSSGYAPSCVSTVHQQVLYGEYDGTPVMYNGADHQFIRDDNILFVYSGERMAPETIKMISDQVLVKVGSFFITVCPPGSGFAHEV